MNDHRIIREVIEDVVQRLVSGYAPKKVILFGSHASGNADEDSDIDLLIIKDTDQSPEERWADVKRLLRDRNRLVSVSPLVYTTQEIRERMAMKDFFLQEVLDKGEILYG